MRRVYALLGLARRYGPERLEEVCRTALDEGLLDLRRIERILANAQPALLDATPAKVLPLGRFLRPASHYALSRPQGPSQDDGGDR